MKRTILFLIMLIVTMAAVHAYTVEEVDSNPYVGVRHVPGQNLVVYPQNSTIVYADADGPVKYIDLEPIYGNLSLNYTYYEATTDRTSKTIAQDGTANPDNIRLPSHGMNITLSDPMTADGYLELYLLSGDSTDRPLYVTDENASTVYGTGTLQGNYTGYHLVTIDLTNTTGVSNLWVHHNGTGTTNNHYIDYIGVYEITTTTPAEIEAQCDRDKVVQWGVFGSPLADEEKDLFFYCNALGEIHHYDYSAGTIHRVPYDRGSQTCLTQTTNCNFQEVHAVTEDWYLMGCYEQDTDIRYHTVNKTNLTDWNQPCFFGVDSYNPGTIAPAFGYTNDEGYLYPSNPVYIEEWPNTFFSVIGWKFGSSQYTRSNLIQIQANGIPVKYTDYQYQQNPTNDTNSLKYYTRNLSDNIGGGRLYEQDEGREWCSEVNQDQFYCHNGAPIDDSGRDNNVLVDLTNGGQDYKLNTATLPNGSIIDIRTYDVQGTSLAYIYDDLDVQLVSGNSILLDKGGIDLFNSYGMFHQFIEGALYYMPTSGSLYKLVGLPTGETLPTIETYARYTDVEDDECLTEGTYLYKNQYNDTVVTEQDENCTYTGSDQYGEPYLLLTDDTSVRTEYEETEILVKSFDVTSDELYVAYTCDYRGQEYNVIDEPDWTEYGDPDTFCNWTQGVYDSHVKGLTDNNTESEWAPGTQNSIDTSTCIINWDYTVESNGASTVTYLQEFLMDDETAINVQFFDIYGDEITNFTIEQEYTGCPTCDYNHEDRFYVDGELKYARGNNDDDYDANTHRVELVFKGTSLSWTYYYRGATAHSGTETLDANVLPPINTIRYNPLSPGVTFNWPDRDVGIGQLSLINGDINPNWDVGVTERQGDDQYRYYEFTCDYTGYDDGLYYLRVYLNDEDTDDYTQYKERVIQVDSDYITYLTQVEDGILVEDAKEQARKAKSKDFVCTVFNTCDDTGRLFIALIVMFVVTFGIGVFMNNNYHNTLASQALPAAAYVALFVFFASIGFLPSWFVVTNIILLVGAAAVFVNPVTRISGGGGGRY